MKALITGGAGFIGQHLARHLLGRGYRIDIADNFVRGARDEGVKTLAASPGVRLLDADLLQADGLADAASDYDFIFHFAAIVGVANVLERPEAFVEPDARGTIGKTIVAFFAVGFLAVGLAFLLEYVAKAREAGAADYQEFVSLGRASVAGMVERIRKRGRAAPHESKKG